MSVSFRSAIVGSITVSVAFVIELTLVPLLLPAIQDEFGLSVGELAWIFNSYSAAVALGVLLGGLLGDVFRAKQVFLAGVVFFASGSVLVALSQSFESMLVARVLQGFGGGVFSPLVPILLTRAVPERPGKVLILWGSVVGYVAASAPLIYSGVLADFGWRLAFAILAVISLSATVVLFFANIAEEQSSPQALRADYAKLVGARDLWLMIFYVFCSYGAFTYFLFRLPLFLSENRFQDEQIGIALTVLWLSFSVLSTLLRNTVDKPHVRLILLIAPFLILAGFPLAFVSNGTFFLSVSAFMLGAGLACSNAPSTQLILRFAPRSSRAISASLDITFARLGGVAVVTFFAQSTFGTSVTVVSIMCCAAILSVALATRSLSLQSAS